MAAQSYKLSIGVNIDAAGAKSGGRDAVQAVDAIGNAAERNATKLQALIDRQVGIGNGPANTNVREWTGALAAQGKSIDDLRAKYNPLFAVITQYKTSLTEIRTLHAQGILKTDEMTAAITRERQATLASIDAIKGRRAALSGMNDNGFAATNAMFQFQDIGMTAAMGMSPGMIGLQQGSQLAGAFSGMSMKQAVSTTATALTALVSPVSLAAIGLTTAAAAAIQFGIGLSEAGDKTKNFDEVLASHEAVLKRLEDRYGTLIESAKAYAGESSGLLLAAGRTDVRELAASGRQAQAEMFNTFGIIRDRVRGGGDFQVDAEFAPFQEAFRTLREQVKAGKPDFDQFYTSVTKVGGQSTAYGLLADKIILASQNAKQFNDLLKQQEERLRAIGNVESRNYGNIDPAFQADNSLRRLNMSRDFSASIDELSARSPEQLAAAARRREANRFDTSEDPETRNQRIANAGKVALAQAEKQLRDAQDQRLRSLDSSLSSQQLELSLIGKTVGETERLRMEYQLTSQLKEEAARTGTEVDQAELDIIRQKSAAYGRLAETMAATNLLRDQSNSLETLRAELSLVTSTEETRRRALALLEAEQQLRDRGIPTTSAAADQYRRQAVAMSELNAQISKQADAWNEVKSNGESAIRGVLGSLKDGDVSGAFEKLADGVSETLFKLGVENPAVNAALGTDYGTLSDVGGLGGIASKLFGKGGASSVASMSVAAGTVIINGGTGSAGSFLNSIAANDNSNVIPLSKGASSALSFVGNYKNGVDARLTDILDSAAKQFPGFKVDAMSGYRAGDPRFHGKGLATDVQLTDLVSGKLLGNYQDASSFSTYERFAQTARQVQMAKYPELADQFRWGGYFSGGKGKYGALDTMHFDLGGAGMGGGSWEKGLTSAQRSFWPGIESNGAAAAKALETVAGQGNIAAQGLGTLGSGFDKFGSALSSMGSGSAGGDGGGLFGWLGKMLGGISPTSSMWAPNTTLGSFLTTGYSYGGWTGDGGILEPAGVVHKREIVWSDRDIRRAGGRDVVEAMRLGKRGYSMGGVVGGGASYGGNAFGVEPALPPIINNYGPADSVKTESQTDSRGRRQYILTIGEQMATAASAPSSPFKRQQENMYGLKTRGMPR